MTYKKNKQYRLRGFDYAEAGEYFITICVKDRKKYLGKIINEEITLSSIGKIVDKVWNEIPNRFDDVKLDAYQIMPDHFHGIVILKEAKTKKQLTNQTTQFKSGIKNNPMELKRITLGRIIRWFKGRVKYEAGKLNPAFRWQSRFYDRVIRDDKEFYFVREYIINNPRNWNKGILEHYFVNIEEYHK